MHHNPLLALDDRTWLRYGFVVTDVGYFPYVLQMLRTANAEIRSSTNLSTALVVAHIQLLPQKNSVKTRLDGF
jgi:hypothetical protein